MITLTDSKGRRTTYLRQIKVATSCDGKTVTGSTILTQAIWHGMPPQYEGDSGDWSVTVQSDIAPKGLPLVDQSKPIGSPFIL